MKKMEFKVEGIDTACGDIIKNQIMKLEGIINVTVDADSELIHVELSDTCSCDPNDVMCQIRNLGYSVNMHTL